MIDVEITEGCSGRVPTPLLVLIVPSRKFLPIVSGCHLQRIRCQFKLVVNNRTETPPWGWCRRTGWGDG